MKRAAVRARWIVVVVLLALGIVVVALSVDDGRFVGLRMSPQDPTSSNSGKHAAPQVAGSDRRSVRDVGFTVRVVDAASRRLLSGGRVIVRTSLGDVESAPIEDGLFSVSADFLTSDALPARVQTHEFRGYYDATQDLTDASIDEQEVTLELQPWLRLAVRFQTEDGSELSSVFGGTVLFSELRRPHVLASYDDAADPSYLRRISRYDHVRDDSTGLIRGQLTLLEPPPAHAAAVIGDTVIARRYINGDETEIVFTIDSKEMRALLGSVRFRLVRGDSGIPLDGAGVQGGYAVTPPWQPAERALRFKPGADGVCKVSGIPAGVAILWIDVLGYTRQSMRITVSAGAETELGDIPLSLGAVALGSVLDDKESVLTADVVAWTERRDAICGRGRYRENYMGEHFAIDGLEAGAAWIGVVADGYAINPQKVQLIAGVNKNVRIRALAGTRVSILTDHNGDHSVFIRDIGELGVWALDASARVEEDIYLLPGRYEAELRVRDRVEVRASFAVTDVPFRIQLY